MLTQTCELAKINVIPSWRIGEIKKCLIINVNLHLAQVKLMRRRCANSNSHALFPRLLCASNKTWNNLKILYVYWNSCLYGKIKKCCRFVNIWNGNILKHLSLRKVVRLSNGEKVIKHIIWKFKIEKHNFFLII